MPSRATTCAQLRVKSLSLSPLQFHVSLVDLLPLRVPFTCEFCLSAFVIGPSPSIHDALREAAQQLAARAASEGAAAVTAALARTLPTALFSQALEAGSEWLLGGLAWALPQGHQHSEALRARGMMLPMPELTGLTLAYDVAQPGGGAAGAQAGARLPGTPEGTPAGGGGARACRSSA